MSKPQILSPNGCAFCAQQVLLGLPFFDHWGVTALSVLPYHFSVYDFPEGHVLYRSSQPVDTLSFLIRGQIRRDYAGVDPWSVVEVEGGVCGDPMALDGSLSDHTATCVTECQVWILGLQGIQMLDYPALERIYRLLPFTLHPSLSFVDIYHIQEMVK